MTKLSDKIFEKVHSEWINFCIYIKGLGRIFATIKYKRGQKHHLSAAVESFTLKMGQSFYTAAARWG